MSKSKFNGEFNRACLVLVKLDSTLPSYATYYYCTPPHPGITILAIVSSILTAGYSPEYMVLENMHNSVAAKGIERQGYRLLRVLRYDSVYVLRNKHSETRVADP